MFHVSGDIQRYLQDFKKVANNAELKHLEPYTIIIYPKLNWTHICQKQPSPASDNEEWVFAIWFC